jgi:hypothetical protein
VEFSICRISRPAPAETVVGTPMELEHRIPESFGGLTEEENLWLACSLWK